MMHTRNGDYVSFELTWDYASYELTWDYEAVQLVYEMDPESSSGYEQLEVREGPVSVLFLDRSGFSADEEAFFRSDVNPVLVIDEPLDTLADRAQAALGRLTQRARALLSSSTPAQARS